MYQPRGCPGAAECDAWTEQHGCICPFPMTRAQLVERIMFAVDGYRFGEWSLTNAGARIIALIAEHPEAISGRPDEGKT